MTLIRCLIAALVLAAVPLAGAKRVYATNSTASIEVPDDFVPLQMRLGDGEFGEVNGYIDPRNRVSVITMRVLLPVPEKTQAALLKTLLASPMLKEKDVFYSGLVNVANRDWALIQYGDRAKSGKTPAYAYSFFRIDENGGVVGFMITCKKSEVAKHEKLIMGYANSLR